MADHLPAKVTLDNVFPVYLFFLDKHALQVVFSKREMASWKIVAKEFFRSADLQFLETSGGFQVV